MRSLDPKPVFNAIHTTCTGEIMQLMDGFYSNIEDSLFELAYTHQSSIQQRHLGELMRELRHRREHLTKTFGKRINLSRGLWFGEVHSGLGAECIEERILANNLAQKCDAHFGALLRTIAQRSEFALGRSISTNNLPIGPSELAYHFLISCRNVKFEKYSIDVVKDVFARFVLDRLGGMYGNLNNKLEELGYYTEEENQQLADVSA